MAKIECASSLVVYENMTDRRERVTVKVDDRCDEEVRIALLEPAVEDEDDREVIGSKRTGIPVLTYHVEPHQRIIVFCRGPGKDERSCCEYEVTVH